MAAVTTLIEQLDRLSDQVDALIFRVKETEYQGYLSSYINNILTMLNTTGQALDLHATVLRNVSRNNKD